MVAAPVVGDTAMPKSSNKSRLPVHEIPPSHTPPKWTTGLAASCVNALPATVAARFWAKYTYYAADAGYLSCVVFSSKNLIPYLTTFSCPRSQALIHGMIAVADSAWFTWIGPVQLSP